jgi:NADH-quinone oxidoreductase subunit G
MSDDQMVTIEVDGRELKAKAGTMLIEVTDAAGISVPRFCYHRKLSISANCRMCLVEVEKVPKPLPACATPVNEGMKVHTRSPLAIAAQKGTMEFLLINHPLDCPICDQGGECELQDLAMGYGEGVSRYTETKRVVGDKDIGPLIATDFTRCIHCTRCVRFGAEIAGVRELGATGRGEHMAIGTYVEKSVDSELSGNIIDVCPVGSLTSKPFRFRARAWELVQHDTIAPHDSVGSNLHLHERRGRVMRVHPRENEAVNECWISDRDRFSYEGLNCDQRLTRPLIKKNGEWQESDWQQALEAAVKGLTQARGAGGDRLGALISPSATLEELYLAGRLMRGLGSDNIDFRLRQGDFRGAESRCPWLGQAITDLEQLEAALLVGANPRKEQPIFGHRLRKAALEGAQISYINPLKLDLTYRSEQLVGSPDRMLDDLTAVARALGVGGPLTDGGEVSERHQALADQLKAAGRASVLLGNMAAAHPDYSLIRALASEIAKAADATLGYLPEAANSVGARLAGAMPLDGGTDAQSMLQEPRKGYLLLGVEPGLDLWDPALAAAAFGQAEFVVALSCFRSPSLETAADVLLPLTAFAETSGTYVNAVGSWQSFKGAVTPPGEARPGWKILRVLGNLLDLEGFEQESSEQVLEQVRQAAAGLVPDNAVPETASDERRSQVDRLMRIGDVPLYALDPLVRRASALQQTSDAIEAGVWINEAVAKQLGVAAGEQAVLIQSGNRVALPVAIDPTLPDGCVRVPAGLPGTETLGPQFGEVTLEKA